MTDTDPFFIIWSFATRFATHGKVDALVFVADHSADKVIPEIDRAKQIQSISTASGFAGSNLVYLQNLIDQLVLLGIQDVELFGLFRDISDHTASR